MDDGTRLGIEQVLADARAAQKKDHAGRGKVWILLLWAVVITAILSAMAFKGYGGAIIPFMLVVIAFGVLAGIVLGVVMSFPDKPLRGIGLIVAGVVYIALGITFMALF